MVEIKQLNEFLKDPEVASSFSQEEVDSLCIQYPYFHLAHLLRACHASLTYTDREAQRIALHWAAVQIPDRLALYMAIHNRKKAEVQGVSQDLVDIPEEVVEDSVQLDSQQPTPEAREDIQTRTAGVETLTQDAELSPEVVSTSASYQQLEQEETSHTLEKDSRQSEDGELVAEPPFVEEVQESEEQKQQEELASENGRLKAQPEGNTGEELAQETQPLEVDLTGVLEQVLAQGVPGICPAICTLQISDSPLTQEEIDYINTHFRYDSPPKESFSEEPTQQERIDGFLDKLDGLIANMRDMVETGEAGETPFSDLAAGKAALDEKIASERLAELLAEKGEIESAIAMYERLMVRNPEKNGYFAKIIDGLREKGQPGV